VSAKDQRWRIVATPQQRHGLCQLIHGEKVVMKDGGEGRRLRRFMRALGITPIRDELVRSGRVDEDMAHDDTPAVFEVSAENVDFARKLLDTAERKPAVELAIGDLVDVLEAMPASAPAVPEGVPDYDPAAENWAHDPVRTAALEQLDEAIADFTPEQLRRLGELADELADVPAETPAEKGADA
jgi:hypothetical protein